MESKANLVEPKANKKRKHFGEGPSQGKNKYKKFVGKCYICNKQGHRAKDCRLKGQSNENKTQVTEEEELANMLSALVLFEANMVDNPNEWWVDTSATRHVCGERNMFSTYVPVNGRNLIMGNFATSRVVGIGKVVLKITSRKELVLIYVLHVPDICKNLISSSMLSENGFKLVFESDKFVFMKNGMYVGKGYMTNGLFKMNVMIVKRDFNNNKASTAVYLIESFTLWHDRSKDEALDVFKHYKNEVENQLSRKIKAIRSDRGGEYEAPFGEFCSEHGIIHQTTTPYSPQSNGVVSARTVH
ncbi:Retrovirus-related Pol polyprotein from transposon TNT 1-94 [Vitis vinifera]|uniref:Retrovirus-related Pol polyprotein from transposon TNT 1-94 n=1 Tax=Vitis vinifera TaxID=29760 RepID=A0A438IXE4_VITVI|nr:Retrovirus-related Pol polyprotein from transposon TNT 1-94 [Vitis vinifera]